MIDTFPRFWSKVQVLGPDDCWPWLASTNRYGYGQFSVGYSKVGAHRMAYELVIGEIPPGLELDHLCRNRSCCNPAHLEAVTHRENTLRGQGVSAQRARQTHCLRGHKLAGSNLYRATDGRRYCRSCRRIHDHERRS